MNLSSAFLRETVPSDVYAENTQVITFESFKIIIDELKEEIRKMSSRKFDDSIYNYIKKESVVKLLDV